MRAKNSQQKYIDQGKYFFSQTKYYPTSPSFRFHDELASPTTIRFNFGNWDNYIAQFEESVSESNYRLYYGGYGDRIAVVDMLPEVQPHAMYGKEILQVLWDGANDLDISPKEAYITKMRWESITEVFAETGLVWALQHASKSLKFPFIRAGGKIFCSFDTPVIEKHNNRVRRFRIKYKDTPIVNLNGVKANHLFNYIMRSLQ